jgi:ribonuclease Z
MIDAALLGTGGMMPLPGRFLASMLCRVNGGMYLFDCGEGTQVSLKILSWGFKNISGFCFTHFHADHISGLPGMLLAIANSGREEPVRFFGPPGLEHVVRNLCVIAPDLPFPMHFTEWNAGNGTVGLDKDLTLAALPLRHRGPCFAYSLCLSRRGKFDPVRAKDQNIPIKLWSVLQKQNDAAIVYEGKTYTSDMVLGEARKGLKLVYCTDTRPVTGLAGFAFEADLFICEGMYGEEDKQEKAAAHMHMSFQEAAETAKKAGVRQLWLTHFSPAMPDPKAYLSAATDIFPRTAVGRDRMHTTLRFEDEEVLK